MLENEYFVFTGTLTTMIRKQAQSIITGSKGHNQNSVTKNTTRLVTGYFPIDLIKGYHPSQKLSEAKQAEQRGQQIIMMTEKQFIDFLAQSFYLLSQGL
ncbi:BRCT domain-containing protein [Lactococcus lactis]|uniref:BRCT domain-containing protein n=1 Tax=Lactococcus lactis TaxID=1358 RepID=UPI0021A6EBD1|nr:BRCT domain-containing protein [Lactococcus lactis]MCT3137616.1 hypothetical protein [Lactococcus lactis]MDM7660268.1 BRCT domain-containing protein [Lactococcus lactis]